MKKIFKRFLVLIILSALVSISIYLFRSINDKDIYVKVETIILDETSIVF